MAKRRTPPPHIEWTRKVVEDRCAKVGDCLIWRGCVTRAGCPHAGIYGYESKNVRKFVFTALMGKKLPEGGAVQPTCGNLRCLADDCLQAFTKSEIQKKAIDLTLAGKRKRQMQAKAVGHAKLDQGIAADIRRSDRPSLELAQQYGVGVRSIQKIRSNQSWAPMQNSIFNLGG